MKKKRKKGKGGGRRLGHCVVQHFRRQFEKRTVQFLIETSSYLHHRRRHVLHKDDHHFPQLP